MSWKDGPWQAIASAIDGVKDIFPVYEEEATVTMFGNSKSTNESLLNQGVAICFGLIKTASDAADLPFTVPWYMNAEYDLMRKICVVTMRWTYSGVFSQNPGVAGKVTDRFFSAPPDNITPSNPDFAWLDLVLSAQAKQPLKDAMNFKNPVVWGNAADIAARKPSARANGVNALNDSGSRGTFLEKLVLASLSAGCSNTDFWSGARTQLTIVQPAQPANPTSFRSGGLEAGSSLQSLLDELLGLGG